VSAEPAATLIVIGMSSSPRYICSVNWLYMEIDGVVRPVTVVTRTRIVLTVRRPDVPYVVARPHEVYVRYSILQCKTVKEKSTDVED